MSADPKLLRILQVAAAVEGGGGEQIALRIHNALRARGHSSTLAVGRGSASPTQNIFRIPDRWETSLATRMIRSGLRWALAVTRGRGGRILSPIAEAMAFPRVPWDLWHGNEDFTQPGSRHLLDLNPETPDVILLHNLHARWNRREGFFDLACLPELSRRAPMLLFPQDPWLLTGHCAHPIACPRWRIGCGQCPDLAIYPSVRRDATAWNFRRKRHIYAHSRLFLTAPSGWLLNMFTEAGIPLAGGRLIANGVNTAAFQPGDRTTARKLLGLNPQRKVVMISGNYLRTNPWKGYAWVVETATRMGAKAETPPVDFLCVGEAGEPMEFGRARIVFAGRGIAPEHMPDFYHAADIYFHPSRADTAPFSVLEAMSCGLPAVATSVCGIPEQVADGETGFLVAPGDSDAMAAAIKRLLTDEDLAVRMGTRGRERVLAGFDFSKQVNFLLAWMQEIAETMHSD